MQDLNAVSHDQIMWVMPVNRARCHQQHVSGRGAGGRILI